MSTPVFRQPGDETANLRQLKVLVILLLLSNIALGVFGFYFLRGLDEKYSTLIGQTVPTLNDLQAVTAASGDAMRSTRSTVFVDAPGERAKMIQLAVGSVERDRALRRDVLKRQWFSSEPGERQNIQESGDAFSRAAMQVIDLLAAGNNDEAIRQRKETLWPAYESYVAAATKATDSLQTQSLRNNDTISARTWSASNLILGLGSWPVMILFAFLLMTAVFVIVILLKVSFFKSEAL